MKKFWAWLVLSSNDPQKVSLTVKSVLTGLATYALFFTGLFHLNVGASDLSVFTDQIATLVGSVLTIVSCITGVYGFIRKIINTMSGRNEVINTNTTLS